MVDWMGTPGDDNWLGDSFDNVADGLDGDDTLTGGSGDDYFDGGAGNDKFAVGLGDGVDTINGGDGEADRVMALTADTVVELTNITGIEIFDAGGFRGFRLLGAFGDDLLDLSSTILIGVDRIDARAGNDTITGSIANDRIFGGLGDDLFLVTPDGSTDTLVGGQGYDTICATGASVSVDWTKVSGVEFVSGNAFANFTLTGNAASNLLDFTWINLVDVASIDGGGGNDTILGSYRGDRISGGSGTDSLNGGGGNDIFLAAEYGGTDYYVGGSGTDTIIAASTNASIDWTRVDGVECVDASGHSGFQITGTIQSDFLDFRNVTLQGVQQINGGGGNDTIAGSPAADRIFGGVGDDTFVTRSGDGQDTLAGGVGNDRFVLGQGLQDDSLFGGSGVDMIEALDANATIDWSRTRDVEIVRGSQQFEIRILGSNANDVMDFTSVTLSDIWRIDAGSGDDTIIGSQTGDCISGGSGNDVLDGGAGNDTFLISFGGGNDRIIGGDDVDLVEATGPSLSLDWTQVSGVETVSGIVWWNNFRIVGTSADDTLDFTGVTLLAIERIDAGAGNDVVIGSAGDDRISGGYGDDSLMGGEGNDTFLVTFGGGNDDIVGGDGIDTVAATGPSLTIDWTRVSGIEVVDGILTSNNLRIVGTANADALDFTGVTLNAIEFIEGGGGNDTIIGSAGNDVIIGSSGADVLSGGDGADVFRLASLAESSAVENDCITDLSVGDTIDLAQIDANTRVYGNQAFDWIGDAEFSSSAGQLRFVAINGDGYILGDVNGDAVADLVIGLTGVTGVLVESLIL